MNKRFSIIVAIGLVVSLFTASLSAAAQENGNGNDTNDNDVEVGVEHEFEIHGFAFHAPEFDNVWERTDLPVLDGDVARSWLWGPAANTNVFAETYAEGEDGTRLVQYGDKSRMEMPVPGSASSTNDADSPWNITQGLLALELLTGSLQLGDDTFEQYEPADIPIAGDWEDNDGPTYAEMARYMDWEPRPAGHIITQAFDDTGHVADDDHFAQYEVRDVAGDWQNVDGVDHNIASVFWDFMQSEGLIYDNGDLTEGPLFQNEFYAIGYPVTEAYWGVFTLRGETQDILVQCFERRCLTFAPDNEPEWQVESGNIGLHYHEWRYNIIDEPVEPEPGFALALAQEDDRNDFGTSHELTATLTHNGEAHDIESEEDVNVSITRDGDELETDSDLINIDVTDNVATIVYPGPAEGTDDVVDTIDVSVSVDGTVVVGEPTLTKTWGVPAPEFTLTLAQEDDRNDFGTDHTFTATLNQNGDAFDIENEDDVTVRIVRGGQDLDPIDDLNVSINDNVATITYAGPEAGDDEVVDTIHTSVAVNGTIIHEEETLTKTWAAPVVACDATVTSDDSIQEAIDNAEEGDVICAEAGTYNEEVLIGVDGVTLRAVDGPDETTIQSGSAGTNGVVGIAADNVTVEGFTINNEDEDNGRAIAIHGNTTGITIQDNVVSDAFRGIQGDLHGRNVTDLTITGNTFNTSLGIAGTEEIDGLDIADNTFNTDVEGIGLGEGITNFSITSNDFVGAGDYVADYRDPIVTAELEAIIDANTFEQEVHVDGNAIVDIV